MNVILSDLLTSPVMVKAAIFGAAAAGVWWLLDVFSSRKPRAEERLEEIRDPNSRKLDLLRDKKGKSNAMTKVLEKASPALAKPLQPKSSEEFSKVRLKLNQAGFRGETSTELYWSLKMIGLGVGLFVGGGAMVFTKGLNVDSLTYAGIIGGVGTVFGKHGVNIGQMAVGRASDQPGGDAVGVLNLDAEPSPEALQDVRNLPSIDSAKVIHLPPTDELPTWLQA